MFIDDKSLIVAPGTAARVCRKATPTMQAHCELVYHAIHAVMLLNEPRELMRVGSAAC